MIGPKCINCGVSADDEPLYRTAPLGVIPPDWECKRCLEVDNHPAPDVDLVELVETISNA